MKTLIMPASMYAIASNLEVSASIQEPTETTCIELEASAQRDERKQVADTGENEQSTESRPEFAARHELPFMKRRAAVEEPDTTRDLEPPRKRLCSPEAVLEMNECPVCLETPRETPTMGCRNGHTICTVCRPKLSECPVCRDKQIDCRNIFADRMIGDALKVVPINCKNRHHGCPVKKIIDPDLLEHEKVCIHREVSCPAVHRKTCNWSGPLTKILVHVKDTKCLQLLRQLNTEEPFHSTIGDFQEPGLTVFDRSVAATHWKPVLFLSQPAARFFLYGLIERDTKGVWTFMVRSLCHKEFCDNIYVDVTIKPAADNQNDHVRFSFKTNVVPATESPEEVVKSGRYIKLVDDQVKLLSGPNALFQYTVSISGRYSNSGTIDKIHG